MNNKLYLVVPCYNEEEVLPETSRQLQAKMESLMEKGKISRESRIVLVNDGSKDRTWEIIRDLHEKDPLFSGVKLSRNKGHQFALLAGLMTVKDEADFTISLDADLQDDVDAIDEMVDKYLEGCDIVYGVRSARETDTFFKKSTAEGFYKIMKNMGVEMTYNHADYRLMSRRALDALQDFREVNLFLRGIVPLIGYKTDVVTYERHERFAGESKYPLKKMLAFAGEGITSMTIRPIRLILSLGCVLFLLSLAALIVFLVRFLCGFAVEGWLAIAASIWTFGSLQLIAIGVVGEYVGKNYLETKARPRYIVEEYLHGEE